MERNRQKTMYTAMPLTVCGAVTLLRQNHLRKTRKAPCGQSLAGTQLLFISHHTESLHRDDRFFTKHSAPVATPCLSLKIRSRRGKKFSMNKETKECILMEKGMKKRPGTAYEQSELPERSLFHVYYQKGRFLPFLFMPDFCEILTEMDIME